MRVIRVIISFLGSKTLTVWLVGALIVYYLTVAVWSREAFATFILNLSRNDLFRVLYVLFVINAALRIIAALKALWPRRRRFFLKLPLYAGLLLFIAAAFMSLNVRKSRIILLGHGDRVTVAWDRAPLRVIGIESALKKRMLRTEGSAVFDYEPSVTLIDGRGRRYSINAFPPKKIGSSFMHIMNFGIGPGVELRKGGRTVTKGYMALRLTPFGAVDRFAIDPYPYTFYLSILPNRVLKKGNEAARDYDLTTPRYRVEVTKGDRVIAGAETDTMISFDKDMSLHFSPPDDWVLLQAAYDPFFPWFVTGLVLLLLGSILYPFTFLR